jgi:uncharacterized membrane protein YbhN (UPF0104 family)
MNDAPQKASPWFRSLALAGVGVGLLVGLWAMYGQGEVGDALRRADRGLLLLALGLFCLQIPILALRWWWVLRLLGMPIRFGDILAAHCGAAVTNFALPGHFGEAVLSAWLERTGRAPGVEAFTALVACKVLTVLVSLGMLAVGLLATDADAFRPLRGPTFVAVVLGVIGAVLVVRYGGSAEAEGSGWRRIVARARVTLADLGRNPGALLAGLSLTVVNAVVVCFVLACVYAAAGAPLSATDTVLLRAIDSLGHGVAGWIPGNLGVDEAVFTLASHHGLGVDGPLALTSALLHKGVVIGYVAIAGLVFVATGARS